LGEPIAVASDQLVAHDLLLVVNGVFECPKLLRLCQFTLHCPLGVIDLGSLKLLQLLGSVSHAPLDLHDLIHHLPKVALHVLLQGEDLRRDQLSEGGVGERSGLLLGWWRLEC
jgi:hypothetical protein